MRNLFLFALMSLLIINCRGKENLGTPGADEDLSSSLEDAVTTMGAMIDDQAGESYAKATPQNSLETLEEILFPKAYAAGCIRPVFKACSSGIKNSQFSDCSMFRGQVLASGEINLDYSQNDCSMDQTGDDVARTYQYELVGPRGGQLSVTSQDQEDYRGEIIGGGALLTKTSSGHSLDILGKNKIFTRNGRVLRNKSIRTISALEISGGLARGQRQVNNGQIEVIHNLAEFVATYSAQDLRWSSSCCHPVSGSLSVEYTGSLEGTAQVEFQSCGQATLERSNGDIQNVQFTYCE